MIRSEHKRQERVEQATVDLSVVLPQEPPFRDEADIAIQVRTDDSGITIPVSSDEPELKPGQPLTQAEEIRYEQLTAVIQRHRQSFYEVGHALGVILRERLYRKTYRSFAEYCQKEHGFGRSHGYRLVEAAQIVAEMSPIGDTVECKNVHQALEMKRVKHPRPTRPAQAAGEDSVEVGVDVEESGEVTVGDAVSVDVEPPASQIVPLNLPRTLPGFVDMHRTAELAHNIFSDSRRRQECLNLLGKLVGQLQVCRRWEENTRAAA